MTSFSTSVSAIDSLGPSESCPESGEVEISLTFGMEAQLANKTH